MQLECKNCHRTLNLPDDKLPVGRPFAFNCPYCKFKNTALIPGPDAPEQAEPPAPEPAAAPEPAKESPPANHRVAAAPPDPLEVPDESGTERSILGISRDMDLQAALSEAADDRPKAIVVYDDPMVQEFLAHKLNDCGYKAMVALNPRDAAKQLKFINFSLLVLQEDYCGGTLHGNLLLRSLQTIDISNRRGMLIILVSPSMTSLDDLTAFSLSIDGIVNVADLASIDRLLVSITARAAKSYAVYREILSEHGLD